MNTAIQILQTHLIKVKSYHDHLHLNYGCSNIVPDDFHDAQTALDEVVKELDWLSWQLAREAGIKRSAQEVLGETYCELDFERQRSKEKQRSK
jgi:hypothetical protein